MVIYNNKTLRHGMYLFFINDIYTILSLIGILYQHVFEMVEELAPRSCEVVVEDFLLETILWLE